MVEKFMFRLADRLLDSAHRFKKWVYSSYHRPFVSIVDISFKDPFGNDFEDPLHNTMEFDWNDEFLGFLWDNGYTVNVENVKTKEDAESRYAFMIDSWLLDCYHNAVYEASQRDSFVKDAPTDPGFTRRTRPFRRWENDVSEDDVTGHMQDFSPVSQDMFQDKNRAEPVKTWAGGTERTLGARNSGGA